MVTSKIIIFWKRGKTDLIELTRRLDDVFYGVSSHIFQFTSNERWRSLAGNGGVWHTPNPCYELGLIVILHCYTSNGVNTFFEILIFAKRIRHPLFYFSLRSELTINAFTLGGLLC
jgi:hypothetical protein